MKKQILAALCAAAMLGSMISAPAFAEETVTAQDRIDHHGLC